MSEALRSAQGDITLRFHNPYLLLTQTIQIVDQFINPLVRRFDLFFQPFLLNWTLRQRKTLMQRQYGLQRADLRGWPQS